MAKNISDNCEFELCDICQKEDSKKKMVPRVYCEKKIHNSKIRELYEVTTNVYITRFYILLQNIIALFYFY